MQMQAPTLEGLIKEAMAHAGVNTVEMASRLGTTKQAVSIARRKCAKLSTATRYLHAATGTDYGIVCTSAGYTAVPDTKLVALFSTEPA